MIAWLTFLANFSSAVQCSQGRGVTFFGGRGRKSDDDDNDDGDGGDNDDDDDDDDNNDTRERKNKDLHDTFPVPGY